MERRAARNGINRDGLERSAVNISRAAVVVRTADLAEVERSAACIGDVKITCTRDVVGEGVSGIGREDPRGRLRLDVGEPERSGGTDGDSGIGRNRGLVGSVTETKGTRVDDGRSRVLVGAREFDVARSVLGNASGARDHICEIDVIKTIEGETSVVRDQRGGGPERPLLIEIADLEGAIGDQPRAVVTVVPFENERPSALLGQLICRRCSCSVEQTTDIEGRILDHLDGGARSGDGDVAGRIKADA